ncbi:ABC transporter substrate-binding protein [Devosia sp. FJ2-5-3]|jgi:peptide/nickel transport system substrate-binding protein|uniref:ABC transporter substrate-binding protein n=1 Tax=Devosia sp. FJ2-5-3 TaxID=2976680 RepID=UPI0023D89CF2|nr:ABC transporter substrate-binding protein [Devosia sp. FJ2-5-3]WEJ59769.1 ABC transporter substrate-binding protein [Devosia sp. FJ2-5-3]
MNLNRRNFMELAAASTALTAVGVSAASAQGDDTIRIGIAANNPRHSDPNQTTQGPDNWAVEQLYEQLVRPDDGKFALAPDDYKPVLATEWSVSEDAKTWTFKLREGVQFHRGYGEMTSEDVVFTFLKAKEFGTGRVIFANIEDAVGNGPYEVVITLKQPDVNFLGTTVFSLNANIVSKKAYEEIGVEKFTTDAVGTGPYELTKYDAESGTYLTRFADYWGEPAKVANIECLYIADTTARTLALVSGQVDMIEAVRAPGWIDSILQRDPNMKVDMTVPGSFNTLHVNLTRAPFDNILVRRALMHAIDRNLVAEALAPMGGVLVGLQPDFFPPGLKTEDLPEELRYEYDPEKSKALLAEAGFPDGISFDALCSQREDYSSTMLIVQELIRPAGFNMNLIIGDHTAYHADNRSDKNTLAMHASSYPPIPTQIYIQQLYSKAEVKADGSGGGNYSHYGVAMPGIDDLLEQALAATNYDTYVDLCRQIELQVLRDLPLIGLSTLSYTMVRNPRLDLGYEVESGYARWRLHRATKA